MNDENRERVVEAGPPTVRPQRRANPRYDLIQPLKSCRRWPIRSTFDVNIELVADEDDIHFVRRASFASKDYVTARRPLTASVARAHMHSIAEDGSGTIVAISEKLSTVTSVDAPKKGKPPSGTALPATISA